VIWIVAAAVVLLWPSANNRSLLAKFASFAVDPGGSLPVLPPPIPLGLGDDADFVMQHDAQQAAYYDAYDSSAITRARMIVRDWTNPLAVATTRQILIALVVFGGLLAWRLDASKRTSGAEEE
jgi:hypothetical protein